MGISWGVPGLFQAVPGCFGGVSGVFRGVPGVFRDVPGVFRGVPGVVWVLTPQFVLARRVFGFFEKGTPGYSWQLRC